MQRALQRQANGLIKTLLAIGLLILGGEAIAAPGTAANTQLQNTVTANYSNLGNTPQAAVTATASITVLLLPAQPNVAHIGTVTEGVEEEVIGITFRVTTAANGEDTYTLAGSDAVVGVSASIFAPVTPFSLGATTVATAFTIIAGGGNSDGAHCTTTVPADICILEVPIDTVTGTGSSINGLTAGDLVTLSNGATEVNCTVASAVNAASGPTFVGSTSTLNVQNCSGGLVLASGDNILEYTDINLSTTLGTLNGAADGTATVTATVGIDGGASSNTASIAITVKNTLLGIYKVVRNLTPVTGAAATADFDQVKIGDNTYYKTGVTAKPGDVLEYAIVLQTLSGAGANVIVTDALTLFTTFNSLEAATASDNLSLLDEGTASCTSFICEISGTFTNKTEANDADQAKVVNDLITVYAGLGGTSSSGGTIAPGKVSVVIYQVTVD